MDTKIMSLGWYVRFVPVELMETMDDFYAKVIGLPRLWHSRVFDGKPENKDLYWAGEAIVENHNYGGWDAPVSEREACPDTARQVQIFRVRDLDEIVAGLRGQGVTVFGPSPCLFGHEAFVLDPMGMLFGLRERDANSPLVEDRVAAQRRERGEAFNPGCKRMPPSWQEIGWVRMRAKDLNALRAFYAQQLGLRCITDLDEAVLFDLGDNTTLELAAGGVARPPPLQQMNSLSAMILRVASTTAINARLKSNGVHFVHDLIQIAKGDLSYVCDPEGNVIGLSDRRHPGAYVDSLPRALPPVSLEDVEAERRWIESHRS